MSNIPLHISIKRRALTRRRGRNISVPSVTSVVEEKAVAVAVLASVLSVSSVVEEIPLSLTTFASFVYL